MADLNHPLEGQTVQECWKLHQEFSNCLKSKDNAENACPTQKIRWLLCTQSTKRPESFAKASTCFEQNLHSDLTKCDPLLSDLCSIAANEVLQDVERSDLSLRDAKVLEKCSSLRDTTINVIKKYGTNSPQYHEAAGNELDCYMEGCCLQERIKAYSCLNNDPTGGERCTEEINAARAAVGAFFSRISLADDDYE